MATEKDWVDIFQALLTPTIAILGVFIAYQQWHINKVRLKHELYDRRMAIYSKLLNYLAVIFRQGEERFNNEAFIEWKKTAYEGYFLFNDEIVKYFELINKKSSDLRKVYRTISNERAKAEDERWAELALQEDQLRSWFDDQFNEAKEKFSPFLRIDR